MQNVFVTGASGFIGRHLTKELIRRDAHVKCLVRPGSSLDPSISEKVEVVPGRLEDRRSYQDAIHGCDTVIHSAGLNHSRSKQVLFRTNGSSCGELSDACRNAAEPPHLIHLSSLAAAGPTPHGKSVREEADEPAPISNYGHSKRLGELELIKRAADLPITVFRPGIVFGPGDPQTGQMLRVAYQVKIHFVIGFRTPPLSLIYVDDLISLVLDGSSRFETLAAHAGDHYSPRGFYFACDDSEHPNYWELGRKIGNAFDCAVMVWPLWRWVGFTVGALSQAANGLRGGSSVVNVDKVREAVATSWASSCAKARDQLGFRPARTLDERFKETADWLLNSHENSGHDPSSPARPRFRC